MKEFLTGNWLVILMGAIVLGYIVYLVINRRWTKLREMAYRLIRKAEKVVTGTKAGQERFNLVLNQIYNMIPQWLKFFIPRTYLEKKLQEWFDMIKDSLDDGEINKSVK